MLCYSLALILTDATSFHASRFVTNHTVHIFIGGVEEKLVANKAITQYVKVGIPLG
jgi:hypothetical protein